VPSKRNLKRAAWFTYGVEALGRARPKAPRVYGCPFCLRGFDDPEMLSLEDVPPKSIGGKPLVLTCRACNNRFGHLLDVNIRSGRDLREMAEGKREAWIKLSHEGHTITAKAMFSPGGSIRIAGVPEKSNPKAHQSLFKNLDEIVARGSLDWDFTIGLASRHNKWREGVGWLRVAYLYVFAALGYNFILRPELNVVREQFQRPDDRVVPQAMKHTGNTSSGDGISFVYAPTHLRSVLVRLGVNMFLFPAFSEAATFYERLASVPASGKDITISGTHIDLPKRPWFEFDYNPRSMWLTIPAEERPRPKHGV